MPLMKSTNFSPLANLQTQILRDIPNTGLNYFVNETRFYRTFIHPLESLQTLPSTELLFTLRTDSTNEVLYSEKLNLEIPIENQLLEVLKRAARVEEELCHKQHMLLPRDLGEFTDFDESERELAFIISNYNFYAGWTHAKILQEILGIPNNNDGRPDLPQDIPFALGEIIYLEDSENYAFILEESTIMNISLGEVLSLLKSEQPSYQIYLSKSNTGWLLPV